MNQQQLGLYMYIIYIYIFIYKPTKIEILGVNRPKLEVNQQSLIRFLSTKTGNVTSKDYILRYFKQLILDVITKQWIQSTRFEFHQQTLDLAKNQIQFARRLNKMRTWKEPNMWPIDFQYMG
jgi:hypothetical protein